MKRLLMIGVASLAILGAHAAQAAEAEPGRSAQGAVKYTWAGPSMDGELWGMARGDIDADNTIETVLLERRKIRVGVLADQGFEQAFECTWRPAADAARVYLIDLDGDSRLEAVVSAVEDGMPSSIVMGLDLAAGACREIVSRARYSLRVVEICDEEGTTERVLAGQGWSSADFFSGAVREITLEKGRLKAGKRFSLPRNTDLFQFAILPPVDERPVSAVLKGPSHMEVLVNRSGKQWKRIWRSGERLGGSANWLPAEQRQALDQLSSDMAIFDMPPIVVGSSIVAVKADMPARDIVGTAPYVRGGEVVEFAPDPALGYVEAARTQWLSGAIMDMGIVPGRPGSSYALMLLTQPDTSAFGKSESAKMISFELSAGKR